MNEKKTVTEKSVARSLRTEFGVKIAPGRIRLEWRSWRWLAHLPDNRVAYIAETKNAAQRLAREHTVLDLLKVRVSFGIPVVEWAGIGGWLQVRTKIPGIQVGGGPERQVGRSKIGPRLASDLGHAYAELHQSLTLEECEALGIGIGGTLPAAIELEQRLPDRLIEREVADVLEIVLDRYARIEIPKSDLAFCHGDPWGGNFAVDPETGALNGIFDFDEMAIDDRNLDLRYLHSFGKVFKDRAIAAYAQSAERPPSAERISLYHWICALDALAKALLTQDVVLIAKQDRWVRESMRELMDDLR